MRRLVIVFCLSCCALSCAVSSPPIQHLQLDDGAPAMANSDSPVISIDAVTVPDYLLREELLRRVDPYTVTYEQSIRWAEPLDLGIQRVIAARLEAALNTRQVVAFPNISSEAPDWRLRVVVKRFEASKDSAVLEAEGQWSGRDTNGKNTDFTEKRVVNFRDTRILTQPSPAATAAALSSLLADFTEALAEPIRMSDKANPG